MSRKKMPNNYGTETTLHKVEYPACTLLPEIPEVSRIRKDRGTILSHKIRC